MRVPFFLLFIIVPLAELFVFMQVSDVIGLGTALFMALFTAILGGAIVRYQGLQTLMNAQRTIRDAGIPTEEIFDGLCLVAAGATLITPGFITDTIGFLLLVPALRRKMRRTLVDKFTTSGTMHTSYHEETRYTDSDVIDVEYHTVETDEKNNSNKP